jgi:hypothetical protein
MSSEAEFRVSIDGDPVRHQSARGLVAVLTLADGATAEVQVAKVGTDLVVVCAGLYGYAVNDRGHLVVSIGPTPGKASGPET